MAEAYANGVNFFDTADIYQNGASEHTVGQFLKQHPDVHYTTKIGRKDPLSVTSFNKEHLESYVEESLANLGVDSLDMVLLHCPPMSVYYMPETFFALDELKKSGKIQNYGVSVERVEEALKALSYDVSAVEIIFNMFRLRPRDLFFDQAKKNNVGILARVPLASGLLTGKYSLDTQFPADDHRTTNRNGELFDKGETFSGVDYKTGISAANELKKRLGTDNLASTALKFILMHDAVSTVIPGASKPSQIGRNTIASDLPELTPDQMNIVQDVYNKFIKDPVDYLW
ncbi:aldo/keto reductase [Lentilactobacillus kosonis]|uniref:Aldo/keto reductase n=1 Tax=Lentilactobacillus kosonis TaxID=2810561 RepID=A0A401FJ87_9LACO|nr:aldo/keto reductase [Lentilactobacillus kosonis]